MNTTLWRTPNTKWIKSTENTGVISSYNWIPLVFPLTPSHPSPLFWRTFWNSVMSNVFFTLTYPSVQFSSVQSLSRVWLFATPWISAHQASLSITNSRSSLRLTSIESVMPSSHLILCHPLLLLPPMPPSIRVFSNESTLHMRWPKFWSFSFSIIPSKEHTHIPQFSLKFSLRLFTMLHYLQNNPFSHFIKETTHCENEMQLCIISKEE